VQCCNTVRASGVSATVKVQHPQVHLTYPMRFASADDDTNYLHINTHRVVVGFAARLVFRARFARDTAGATAQLYQSAQPGALTALISPLVDDGLFSHRDDAAGDMVFSATFTATYDTPGAIYFAATNSNDQQSAPLTAAIAVVEGAEQSHREAGLAAAQQLQAQLDRQIANGTARLDALNNIREALLDRLAVAASDVIVSGRMVRWTTAQGLRFAVQAFVGCERSGGRGRGLLGKDAALGVPYKPAAAQRGSGVAAAAAAAAATSGERRRAAAQLHCTCTGCWVHATQLISTAMLHSFLKQRHPQQHPALLVCRAQEV
jgi:hypothetical protein